MFQSMHLPEKHRSNLGATIVMVALGLIWVGEFAANCPAQSRLDDAPINYLETAGDNRVTELFSKVESGEIKLRYEEGYGYLKSMLDALEIPISSQSLVFSKTSLQSARISPKNPRAIFFNEDVYVGWVRGSALLEISTADPRLGAAFYSVQMMPRRPYMRRENNRCLACHEKTTEQGKVPVHMVRSVMTRSSGKINLLLNSFVTDHTSPIAERWGGWYVTGHAGEMGHMGNAFLEGEELVPLGITNVDALSEAFDTKPWLSPHSDIVALMVLEHQTQMHNRLTRADYAVRHARYAAEQNVPKQGSVDQGSVDQGSGAANDDAANDDIESVIDKSAKLVVDHLLFTNEARLESQVKCSTTFVHDFAARGPFAADGKSLRDFDLATRLFRHPCSYLIYSSAFDALDEQLRQQIYARMLRVLTNQDLSEDYAHLSDRDRASILSILRETKQGLPDNWKISGESPSGT